MLPRLLLTAILALGAQALSAAPSDAASTATTSYVFVPYDKMTGPEFGKDQSVLLPYAEFLRLKNTAAGRPESPKFRPSVSLSQAAFKGVVEGQVAAFDSEFGIEVLARPQDNLDIQLPFAGASVEKAVVEGPQASISPLEKEAGLRVQVQGPGKRTLKLRIVAPLKQEGAIKKLDFRVPRAAAASLNLRVGEDVVLEPVADSLPATVTPPVNGAVEINASCGSNDRLLLAYRPRIEAKGAAAESRLAILEDLVLNVASRSASAKVRMNVMLLAGTAKSVALELPQGVQLLSVSGAFVKDWSQPDEKRRVNVTLVREVTQSFDLSLDVKFDQPDVAPDTVTSTTRLAVPEFRVPGAVRESGSVMVVPDEGLAVWPEETSGLETVSITGKEGTASARMFRFAQPGWKLVLTRKPIAARVRAEGIILYEVGEEFVRLKTRHHLTVSGRGVFDVALEVPEGYELREAGPPELVSGYRQQGRRVEINFRGEKTATMDLDLRLQRTRTMAEPKVALEPVSVMGAEEDAGNVVLATPVALKATEAGISGVEATDVRALQQRLQGLLSSELVPVLGYRYFMPRFQAAATIERQRTRLTCETSILASLQPALMRVDASLNYNVEFSATDEFQLMVPASAGEDIRWSGPDIKEKNRTAPDSSTSDSAQLTTWTIRLQRRVIGPYRLALSFDVPITGAESGKALKIQVPSVRAVGVARETGHIGVSRGENLEVQPAKSEGLEPRDVKELPAGLASAFLGYRYFDPQKQSLELELVRHELEPVLGALIRRMHIDTVITDQGVAAHEAIFEVQNNREQYLVLDLPKDMKIWSAFVRGVPVRPTLRESDKAFLIELTKSESKDEAFRVRLILREDLPGGAMGRTGSIRLECPKPKNEMDMPVLRLTRKLWLPNEFHYVKFGGSMRLETGGHKPWVEPAAEKLMSDLPADFAGGIAKNVTKPADARVPASYDTAETEAEKRAHVSGSALEIPIVRQGLQFEFSKLSGTGTIEIQYWKKRPLLFLQGSVALILAVLLLGLMYVRRSPAIGLVATVLLFMCASLTDGLAGRIFTSAYAASAFAFLVALLLYWFDKAKAAHRQRLEDEALRQAEWNKLVQESPPVTDTEAVPPATDTNTNPSDK